MERTTISVEERLRYNEQIEAERKAWHECKRNESDEWREAYEFLEAQEKRFSDQMAEVFRSMNTVTNQLAQGSVPQPLRQEPEPTLPQPMRQEPDPFNSQFAFGLLAMMFLDTEAMELHHVLPLARFPELGQSIRNGIMLCHKCHKEVHCNQWRNIELMKAKAEELGIDLKERYDYGDTQD